MKEILASAMTSKLAREVGFDEKCEWYYPQLTSRKPKHHFGIGNYGYKNSDYDEDTYSAPTLSVLHDWIIENHGIYVMVIPTITSDWTYKTIGVISKRDKDVIMGLKSVSDLPPYDNVCGEDFRTHNEALQIGAQEALRIIKSKI